MLTVGLSLLGAPAAAEPPVSVDAETEEAEDCTETVAGQEVDRPCEVVETETCTFVFEDHMGQPQLVDYPCVVTLNIPSSSTTASPPVGVDHQESDRCETTDTVTVRGDESEVTIHHPCSVDADVDCQPHPGTLDCTVTLTKPELDDDEPVDPTFCHEGHNFQFVPPCQVDVGV